jgi:hypothetical protein
LPVSIAGKGLQHQSQHHQSQQLLAAAAQQQQQQAPAQAAAAGQPEQDGAAGASPALPDSQCLSDLPLSQFAAQLAREQRLSDQLPRLSDSSQVRGAHARGGGGGAGGSCAQQAFSDAWSRGKAGYAVRIQANQQLLSRAGWGNIFPGSQAAVLVLHPSHSRLPPPNARRRAPAALPCC